MYAFVRFTYKSHESSRSACDCYLDSNFLYAKMFNCMLIVRFHHRIIANVFFQINVQ